MDSPAPTPTPSGHDDATIVGGLTPATRSGPNPLRTSKLAPPVGSEDATIGDTPTHGGSAVARPMPAVPVPEGKPFGRYVLQAPIGHGGMGVVYRAWDTALCRPVALKTLLPSAEEDSEATVGRFLREARSAGRLKHPNVIGVFDVGQVDGRHFFTMELIEGVSVDRWILGEGRPNAEPPGFVVIARLMEKTARALNAAHLEGIVHRDVKPSNILVDLRDEPHLGDFGLAKAVDLSSSAELTVAGSLLGTPQYMSPEQAGGDVNDIGPRSDVYSLGSVLYHALTGAPPFEQPNLAAILRSVLEVDPAPPSKKKPGVPRDLEAICLKTLEKEPARRYASAEELAQDLGRFVEGVAVVARRPGPFDRALRFTRRHRALVAVVALLLLAGGVAGIIVRHESGISSEARTAQRVEQLRARAQDLLASLPPKSRLRDKESLRAVLPRLTEAIAIDPTFAMPYLQRGAVSERLADFDSALADFAKAADLDPTLADADYRRGCVLLERGKDVSSAHIAEAQQAFLDAERARPGSLSASLGEARVALLQEDFARALTILDRLAQDPERHPDVFLLRASVHSFPWRASGIRDRPVDPAWLDLEAAVADLDVALELDPLSSWGLSIRGLSRFALGDLEAARQDLSDSNRLQADPDACYAVGRVAYMQGDFGTAKSAIEEAIALRPDSRYLQFRALLAFWERDYDKGLADMDPVLARDAGDIGAMFVRAVLRYAKGDRKGAEEDLRHYAEAKAEAVERIRHFDAEIARNGAIFHNVAAAFRDIDRIFFLAPERKKQLRGLQAMIGALPWYQAAGNELRDASRNDPETAGLLVTLSRFVDERTELSDLPEFVSTALGLKNKFIFGVEGRFIGELTQEATLLWRKKLTSGKEYLLRASAHYRRGEMKDALTDLEEAARLSPGDADVLYALATVRALTGASDAALAALSQAITAGWAHPEYTAKDPDFSSLSSDARFTRLVGQ